MDEWVSLHPSLRHRASSAIERPCRNHGTIPTPDSVDRIAATSGGGLSDGGIKSAAIIGKLPPRKVTMAMALEGKNRHYTWSSIRLRHWLEIAKRCGSADMDGLVREVVDQTPAAIARADSILPPRFPAAIARIILEGVKAAANELGNELAANSNRPR